MKIDKLPWTLVLLITSLLIYSCQQKSELSLDFNCSESSLGELEIVSDFQDNFSLPIPKHWKTNLYYDNTQSSIYFADTTKQLTETMILDVTFIKQNIKLNDAFFENIRVNYKTSSLTEEINKEFLLDKYPSYYTLAKGEKNKFPYVICNVYINTPENKFMHAKIEVYGDSLVNDRLCKGINLIEKINIK